MLWFVIWTVLVLGALTVLGLLAYRLVRKGLALATQMGEAAELLDRAAAQVERLQHEPAPEPAVFADPHELRREHERRRSGGRDRRRMGRNRAGGR